ncbi:MAG: aldehyde dehydrogenase family protein [Pseudobdellovibrio sp.]
MNLASFKNLKENALVTKNYNPQERIKNLEKLLSWISSHEKEIVFALKNDFNKNEFETVLTEISVLKTELKYFIKNIKHLSKPKKVPTPLTLLGHSSTIRYEGKGVVLIISPWNYPFQLAIAPLIPALAAGNTVVIKPSELTPHTSQLIADMIREIYPENLVTVELGGKEKTEELLTYDFDHVFFTGSTEVGRIIATKCAEKLIPYTLELGGKSPVIIDETADIKDAAQKVYWGKFLNAGQTCVAPDYILIHKNKKEVFIKEFNQLIQSNTESSTGIINKVHFERLNKLISEPISTENDLYRLVDSPDLNTPLMKQEIFGPISPIIEFTDLNEVRDIINLNPHPLALYIFSQNKRNIIFILNNIKSGGVAINNLIIHLANHNLPFGGIRTSGIGSYHGKNGFLEFSHQRSILEQKFFKFSMKLLYPPYTDFKKKLLQWL